MPDEQPVAVAEPGAAVDTASEASFKAFAAKAVSETDQPVKEAESGTADTPKEAKPEGKPQSAAEPGAVEKQETSEAKPEKHKKDKLSAEERIEQLARENREMRESLRKLESAPKPTPQTEAKQEAKAPPKRPNPFKFEGDPDAYDKAMDEYETYLKAQAIAEAQQAQQRAAYFAETKQKLADVKAKYPDADEKIFPTLEKIGKAENIYPGIKDMLDSSDVLPHLLYTLGEDGALSKFIEIASTNPAAAIRQIVVTEQLIREELKGKKEPESEKPEPAKAEVPETKPRAPKPPSEVGGRGTAPEDAEVAAVQAGDFRKLKAEWNRRALAHH